MQLDRQSKLVLDNPSSETPSQTRFFASSSLAAFGAIAALSTATPTVAQAHWIQLQPTTSPPPLVAHATATHTANQLVMVFGGKNALTNAIVADTWKWDGSAWTHVLTPNTPPARTGHGLVENTAAGTLLLYGGGRNGLIYGDTWEWDGATWTQLSPSNSPGVRGNHSMAYHAAADVVVMFGGDTGNSTALGDTWVFDRAAQSWTQVAGFSPPPRLQASMAYDAKNQQVVLFGGGTGPSSNDQTWLFDGATWTQAFPTHKPSPRLQGSMAWDPLRQRLVLNSGTPAWFTYRLTDTWEWDGFDWSVRTTTAGPPLHATRRAMAWDPTTQTVLLVGQDANNPLATSETWSFGTDFVASVTGYGSGCPTSQGMPSLTAAGLPWLGDTVQYSIAPVPPGALSAIFAGLSDTTWNGLPLPHSLASFGFAGCDLLQSAEAATIGNQASVAIPNSIALAGVALFYQGAVLEPGLAQPLGVTAGAAMTIGVR